MLILKKITRPHKNFQDYPVGKELNYFGVNMTIKMNEIYHMTWRLGVK